MGKAGRMAAVALLLAGWGHAALTTVQSVKRTQLLWLKYRDAFAAFAALRYPDRQVEPLKAWLTRQRITDLRHLPLAEGDPDALPSCQSANLDDSPSCDEEP